MRFPAGWLLGGVVSKSRGVSITFLGLRGYVGKGCHFGTNVRFGNHVMIAMNVAFVGQDHRFDDRVLPMFDQGRGVRDGIKVGDDVWIGHGAILLDGIRVGRGAIVGAGSVVTKNIPEFAIWAGNPAKQVSKRP